MTFGDGPLAWSAKSLPTTYSCASGETSPPETAGGSRRRLTAKRRRLILPTYVNRICHDYTRGSGRSSVRARAEAAGATLLPGPFLDFLDPWGNRIEVVEYASVQFTKAPHILRGMNLNLSKM